MKKKIPKWLGKVGAIIGIVAVIVSSMILPVSAGMSTNDLNFSTYTQEYPISSIQMYLFESDNPYRYQDLKNCYVAFTPTGKFPLSSTADGTYTRYDPQCFKAPGSTLYYPATGLLNTTGSAYTTLIGDYRRSQRNIRNFFIFSTDGNGLASTSFSTDDILITFDDIYVPNGRYDFSTNFASNDRFPSIYLNCLPGYSEEVSVIYSFDYEYLDYSTGEVKVSSYKSTKKYSIKEFDGGLWGYEDYSAYKTKIPIMDYNFFLLPAAYYTDSDVRNAENGAYHFFNYSVNIEAEPDSKFSVVGIQYNMPFVVGSDNKELFYEDYENVVLTVDNTADIDVGTWLVRAVGGFMNFEVFPGFSISSILSVVVAITLMIALLKYFAGG